VDRLAGGHADVAVAVAVHVAQPGDIGTEPGVARHLDARAQGAVRRAGEAARTAVIDVGAAARPVGLAVVEVGADDEVAEPVPVNIAGALHVVTEALEQLARVHGLSRVVRGLAAGPLGPPP